MNPLDQSSWISLVPRDTYNGSFKPLINFIFIISVHFVDIIKYS